MANQWLDSTVAAYRRYFGETIEPVIYEVGSRDGKDGVELAERILDNVADVPDWGDIVLFEPNPKQQEVIKQAYPSVSLIPCAASDRNGKSAFLQIESSDIAAVGSSSMDLTRHNTKPGRHHIIEVETRRLDGIIEELEHKTIDIMKIDAEGFTYEILQGLGNRLKDVLVYHMETEMEGSFVTNKTNRQVFEFMRDNGFLCYALEYEWGGIEDQVWVNADKLHYA